MVNNVIHAELVAEKGGTYTMYVFKNLDVPDAYVMCTRLPNWQIPEIQIGDAGFLEYQQVVAGQEYFNISTEQMTKYLYSNIYIINFIQKTDILNNNEIIL
jgi:hypothetical protein